MHFNMEHQSRIGKIQKLKLPPRLASMRVGKIASGLG
jgi:hypothetical protein